MNYARTLATSVVRGSVKIKMQTLKRISGLPETEFLEFFFWINFDRRCYILY
ncbi:hypothetical protein HMPREF1049_1222 [Fusobacterium necrophorum subsp. funduliforme ATCC 51357]|nr:hypothetical protein HMPREF1049_1222 [Fusobacterium necrophorum subsp. funduliforme ATCC 51357]